MLEIRKEINLYLNSVTNFNDMNICRGYLKPKRIHPESGSFV